MQILKFTRDNHAKQLTKLDAIAPVFKKATIKTLSSDKIILETEDFEYLRDYCDFYYNFTAYIKTK